MADRQDDGRMPTDYFIARIVCVCLLVIVLLPVLAIGLFNFWLWWRFHRAEREAQRVLDGRVAQLGRALPASSPMEH